MERQGLYRSRTDRVFGGVAGGIARSLNADPSLIRIVFAILVIFGGGGLLLYLILWIAIPEEPVSYFQDSAKVADAGTGSPEPDSEQGVPQPQPVPAPRNQGALIAGLIMIFIGLIFLADRFLPRIHLGDFWPVLIVIAGLALILSSFKGNKTF